jgi:hypothetical protein
MQVVHTVSLALALATSTPPNQDPPSSHETTPRLGSIPKVAAWIFRFADLVEAKPSHRPDRDAKCKCIQHDDPLGE